MRTEQFAGLFLNYAEKMTGRIGDLKHCKRIRQARSCGVSTFSGQRGIGRSRPASCLATIGTDSVQSGHLSRSLHSQ